MNIDPVTALPLPANAIQRILFIAPKAHIYQIPPLSSTKGYNAASWTANNNQRQIFTARLRILETSIPSPDPASDSETVTTALLLEDPSSGQLFAACPYNTPAAVEQALDSSRFFAIRVVGEGGRKATLGLGFEERSEAFDFSIALQDARRVLGFENPGAAGAVGRKPDGKKREEESAVKRDFSLKEGETITVNIGGRGRRAGMSPSQGAGFGDESALFSIKPPPGGSSGGGSPFGGEEAKAAPMPFLPPPPSAKEVKEERRRSRRDLQELSQDLGFDDGEFGEFQ